MILFILLITNAPETTGCTTDYNCEFEYVGYEDAELSN